MKKAIATRVAVLTLLSLLLAVPLAAACAKPAPAAVPSPATASGPATAPVSKADPMAQIIEGAKKEGVVTLMAGSDYADMKVVERLEKAIKDKYGLDLDIKVSASLGMAAQMANAIMEHQTGAPPTFDLMNFGAIYIPNGMKTGVFERVDWKSLVPAGTIPQVIPQHPDLRGGISYISTSYGLMYNPQKVAAAQVPKKISDLADPKWTGRLGVMDYSSHWTRWAFVLGKDKTLATLRSIMKNKPMRGLVTALNSRYLLGEIDLAFTNSPYLVANQQKGMPTAWQNLDFVDVQDTHLVVRTRAAHPNAAKLLAIFLASPDGAKFSMEVAGRPLQYYSGNYLYDIIEQGKKEGLPMVSLESYPGLLEFNTSAEYERWEKEMELILRGAG